MVGPSPADDLQLTVTRQGGQTRVEALVDKPAVFCYRLFCVPEDTPRWLSVVGRTVVQQRDTQGRASVVDFMGSLKNASIAYTLHYLYDDGALQVIWEHRSGTAVSLAGMARFIPRGTRACRIVYSLRSELSHGLPQWSDELYHDRPAEAVVLDFIEWVDKKWEETDGGQDVDTINEGRGNV